MTKEDILHHFQDINFYYNDCMRYDDLSRMLDELISECKQDYSCSTCKFASIQCTRYDGDVAATDFCGNWEGVE